MAVQESSALTSVFLTDSSHLLLHHDAKEPLPARWTQTELCNRTFRSSCLVFLASLGWTMPVERLSFLCLLRSFAPRRMSPSDSAGFSGSASETNRKLLRPWEVLESRSEPLQRDYRRFGRWNSALLKFSGATERSQQINVGGVVFVFKWQLDPFQRWEDGVHPETNRRGREPTSDEVTSFTWFLYLKWNCH